MVNIRNLLEPYGPVEVRLHSGTLDGPKILRWVSLWMAIMAAVQRGLEPPGDPGLDPDCDPLDRGERGDVAALCRFIGAGDALTSALVQRREQLMPQWAEDPRYGKGARSAARRWLSRAATDVPGGRRADRDGSSKR